MYVDEIRELIKRPEVRSADRANMKTILKKVRGGKELSYQERVNLFAYFNRYGISVVDTSRH